MISFFDSVDKFKTNFFKSYLKNLSVYCDYYQSKIDYNYIFSDFELKILYKLLFNKYFKDKKVLEIGCGAGQLSIFLNLNGIKTDAVDFNSNYITVCKEIQKDFNVSFTIYEDLFYNLSFEIIDSYDCIVSGDCINEVNNNLDISLQHFKKFNKPIFVSGGSFVDNTTPEQKMNSIIFFKDLEYKSLNLIKLNKYFCERDN